MASGAILMTNASKLSDITNIFSLFPIGTPFPWPTSTPPDDRFLIAMGQSFDTTIYTELAKIYPSGSLPDLRGQFIRGWDNNKGIDAKRELLTNQNASLLIRDTTNYTASWAYDIGNTNDQLNWDTPTENKSVSYSRANIHLIDNANISDGKIAGASRPINIAFNFIIRAKS